VNTFEWYKERVYHIKDDHDPLDRVKAFEKSLEWGEQIPLGILYKNNRPTMEDRITVIAEKPLVKQEVGAVKLEKTLREFY